MPENKTKYVGKAVRKKDSLQLLLGKPVYTGDIAPKAPWWSSCCAAPTPTPL